MRAFTLLELVVVMVIIGIVTTLSITHYGVYRESAIDNEAQGNLNLIIGAERTFRIERNNFYIQTSEALLNTNLKLFLPTAATRPWDYRTVMVGANCCAEARRTGGPMIRSWRLCSNGNAPVRGACTACP